MPRCRSGSSPRATRPQTRRGRSQGSRRACVRGCLGSRVRQPDVELRLGIDRAQRLIHRARPGLRVELHSGLRQPDGILQELRDALGALARPSRRWCRLRSRPRSCSCRTRRAAHGTRRVVPQFLVGERVDERPRPTARNLLWVLPKQVEVALIAIFAPSLGLVSRIIRHGLALDRSGIMRVLAS